MSDPVMLIRLANSIKDIPGVCKLNTTLTSKKVADMKFKVRSCAPNELDSFDREQLFAMYEKNMMAHYQANGGWNAGQKRAELFHSMSRYFIVYASNEDGNTDLAPPVACVDQNVDLKVPAAQPMVAESVASARLSASTSGQEILAFAAFRFEWDDDEEPDFPVLYVYEMQVSSAWQGHGFGGQLMALVLKVSDRLKMTKVMLTCFVSNTGAMKFYKDLGFARDCNSPLAMGFKVDYEVLSNRPNVK
jgi:ribosomal protein S18 acetylase RimI-like enzyme